VDKGVYDSYCLPFAILVHGDESYTGIQDYLHLAVLQSPPALQAMALKTKKSKDPGIPLTREALSGPYAEDFWKAMDDEIESLEEKALGR
jgi:hypothetical protein